MSVSKPNNIYLSEVAWLFQQFPSYQLIGSKAFKPTLENSEKIMCFLGEPQKSVKCIHVAGSNGKGSTCSMLASILKEAGYKVGLFTSPHIKDFRERIRINGIQIPEQNVVDFIQKVKSTPLDFEPSFFEITFGMSMEYFKNEKCDICIIETGLGGRLDATNIIHPILSVITNISLEHTAMLGNTLEEIAVEKGGIIKQDTPVVIGEMDNHLYPIFNKIAESKNAPIYYSNEIKNETGFQIPLLGDYQIENCKTVLKSCEKLQQLGFLFDFDIIQKGFDNLTLNTGFSGRLQIIERNPLTIFDVSHNPAGISASLKTLIKMNQGKLHFIYGTSADKDVKSILNLFPKNANYYFTEFSNERSMKIDDIKQNVQDLINDNCNYFLNPNDALTSAQQHANHEDTIVAIGSFFLISDFF